MFSGLPRCLLGSVRGTPEVQAIVVRKAGSPFGLAKPALNRRVAFCRRLVVPKGWERGPWLSDALVSERVDGSSLYMELRTFATDPVLQKAGLLPVNGSNRGFPSRVGAPLSCRPGLGFVTMGFGEEARLLDGHPDGDRHVTADPNSVGLSWFSTARHRKSSLHRLRSS
jgi:hypothetical protein